MDASEQARRLRPDIEKILGIGGADSANWLQDPRSRIIAGIVATVAVVLLMLWWGSGTGSALRYITEPVSRDDMVVIVTATGTVQPTKKVDISSELSGTIRKVLVDYNTRVTAGQSLAELDTDKLEASLESARAKLVAAKARVKDAEATVNEKKLDFERQRQLAVRQVTSEHNREIAQAAYERSLASLESARADVAAAAADVKLSETNLSKTCICSPINGVVLSRNVDPGQTVASNFQAPVLFTIAEDLSQMEAQVDVDEADVGRVKEGQEATFSVDAYPNKKFAARIRELRYGSEVVQGVVTYKAVLTTDNAELLLRPGMTATAEITVQNIKAAVTVPNAALRFAPAADSQTVDDRSFLRKLIPGRPPFRPPSRNASDGPDRQLWILSDGEPKEVTVTIGPTDGRRTQVIKGDIAPGQKVIVDTVSAKK
jgi:HlyD family secretion protein